VVPTGLCDPWLNMQGLKNVVHVCILYTGKPRGQMSGHVVLLQLLYCRLEEVGG